jgi:2-keto-4-pentenoate hydratase/2-oxohepta-3-ene-1,7-dioic acid hydratase in catechol pathway
MRFLSFQLNEENCYGVLTEDKQHIINLKEEFKYDSLLEFITKFEEDDLKGKVKQILISNNNLINIGEVKLISPIPNLKRNIICLGLNYLDHAKESEKYKDNDFKLPEAPAYFSKMAASTIGHNFDLKLDEKLTQKLDYEVELAVVIGKKGTNIPKDKVNDYIFGYTIMNDFTARDLQRKHTQWFKGKSLDNYTSLGPVIASRDEFKSPLELYLRSYVNGELRQNSNTKHLIYNIEEILSDFSKGITLLPGDIIATGTPAGVGMGMNPPQFLKKGDKVVCEIENIGMLENNII